jgi:putative addiction module killer protein
MEVRKTNIYKKWIEGLRDSRARYQILIRIKRLEEGKPIGEGISEMRIDYDPGYRLYYKDTGREIIILLCGGDKSTRQKNIDRAKRIEASPLGEEE